MIRYLPLFAAALWSTAAWGAEFLSHRPLRPLPTASDRPLADGPAYYVDAAYGADAHDGSRGKPWKTLARALPNLAPGDTLYLRGGVYYERVAFAGAGSAEQPITIRAYPGELVVIDGGLRVFADSPATAWEPLAGSDVGEYRSTQAYPRSEGVVLGHFLDSMNTLHGYRFGADIRSVNEYWSLTGKLDDDPLGIYCGPGVWLNPDTGRLHCRLAPTNLHHLGEHNYRGEADPRRIPLAIAGPGVVCDLRGARHVRLFDVVLRGANRTTLNVERCQHVELDGLTVYGGSPAVMLRASSDVKLTRSRVRGISAPWSWRGGQKYRGVAAYLLTARPEDGGCANVEIAYCELTDCHDGPYLGTIRGLRFHHNLVDNFNDDGIYLSGAGVGGDIHIVQNYLTRCLHCFAFAGKYDLGPGVYVARNVIDLRGEVRYQWPKAPDDPAFANETPLGPARTPFTGFLCGDHGSPTWEKIYFYHNTVLMRDKAFRDHYGFGMARATKDTSRRVFNNIFVSTGGLPGQTLPPANDDFVADHNLFWSTLEGAPNAADFFAAVRKSDAFTASKANYPNGWGARDLFADPQFVRSAPWGDSAGDYRLLPSSPAIDAGRMLPDSWPDPLRESDGPPDLGAFPQGAEPFATGPAAAR